MVQLATYQVLSVCLWLIDFELLAITPLWPLDGPDLIAVDYRIWRVMQECKK